MMTRRSKSGGRVALVVLLGATAGCEALHPEVTVSLAISHHGMRLPSGMLPDYGGPDEARIFVNDKGWEVSLAEGVMVYTSAQIEGCDGTPHDFRMPYGPLPEYQLDQDKDLIDFATVSLPEGTYCTLRVEYGRYQAAAAAQAADTPYPVQGHADMEGRTVYLAGTADDLKGKVVNWKLVTQSTTIVELDLSTIEDGSPFRITGEEPGGKALTVAKTYDAFFKGLDFATFDEAASEAKMLDVLRAETYVHLGTSIY